MKNVNSNFKRMGGVDWYRFIFCVCIFLFHGRQYLDIGNKYFHPFVDGAIATDGFFIISGYFLANEAIVTKDSVFEMLKKKVTAIYPMYLFALFIHIVEEIVSAVVSKRLPINFFLLETDIVLLNAYEIPGMLLMIPAWYLSALLFVCAFTFPIIRKLDNIFCLIYSPMIAFLTYGILFDMYGEITFQAVMNNFVIVRGFAGVLLGCFIFSASKMIRELQFTKTGRVILHVIEVCSLFNAIFIMCMRDINICFEFAVVLCWLNILLINFSGFGLFDQISIDTKPIAKFTLALYLNQHYCLYAVNHFMPDKGLMSLLLYAMSSATMSFICMKTSKPMMEWLKRRLLKNETILNVD